MIPGTCNVCGTTLYGHDAYSHFGRCIEARYGIRASRTAPKGRRRLSLRTMHISVRGLGRPHWMELAVRADATLYDLDRFLRSVWLECCGHLSHFDIGGTVYSMMVPRPRDDFEFLPMDEREELSQHMGKAVGTAIKPATWFEHQFDYGTTTDLELRHVHEFEGLAQILGPSQPWHGGKIVVFARNLPLQTCCLCGHPAQWRLIPDEDEDDYDPDDDLFGWEDDEFLFWDEDAEDDTAPNTFCDECAPVDGSFTVLPNSPREGANCYDNVHSWLVWPIGDD